MIHPIEKIARISITKQTSILEVLKRMDLTGAKLLIILENQKFLGLVTIGDIQRAIIKNIPLQQDVYSITRKEIHYGKVSDPIEKIKQIMLRERDECMPIVDAAGNIHDIIFWDDLFAGIIKRDDTILNIPVVIMAGGIGSRMKPLTNIIPKPLIPIGEKTILEIILDKFKTVGCTKFYLSVNYKSETIEFYLKDKIPKYYDITYFKEPFPLGTIGSITLIKEYINTSFFVTNCDILINQDFRIVHKFHVENNNEITMICALKNIFIPYGTVTAGEDGILQELKEKPELSIMINTGMYILEPHLIDEIDSNREFHITELIEKVKKRNGKVGVFPISEKQYFDIGEWDTYMETLARYKQL